MRKRFFVLLTAASASLLAAATTVMPAGAYPVSLACTANAGMRTYTGTITVDSSKLDSLYVGEVLKLPHNASGTITSVNTAPYQMTGTARLSNGQAASVSCQQQ
jgi:hypothetical protein